jgi:aarF domain-containing kinase
MLLDKNMKGVMVPAVYDDLCTRRILVSEWVDGRKLSDCSVEEIAEVTPYAQEAFLTQLFDAGFFHADPHPGNLLYLDEPTAEGHKLALIDCGLMASIDENDREKMISAIIHLANKDYPSLVDDFIQLEILPTDSNRAAIIPLMDKALSPYVKGGGAKKYEEELKKIYGMEDDSVQSQVGGFQAMTQDALTVLNDVPFSIPPYFAILGRAIVTLEGVALTGNPEYGIIMESYPFIARKLLREGRPEIQKALQQVLYSGGSGESSGLKLTRLIALLNNAAGSVATQDGAAFVDLDTVPTDGLSFKDGLKFLLSDNAESLRNLLEKEVDTVVDVLTRQIFRKSAAALFRALTPPRAPSLPFIGNIADFFPAPPAFDSITLPLLLPGIGPGGQNQPSVAMLTLKEFVDKAAPRLDQDEEIFAIGLAEGAQEFFGEEIGDLIRGDGVLRPESIRFVLSAVRSGALGRNNIFSSEAAGNVVQFVQNALGAVLQDTPNSSLEDELTDAVANLTETERLQLDSITSKLTQRSIEQAVKRLDSVARLI